MTARKKVTLLTLVFMLCLLFVPASAQASSTKKYNGHYYKIYNKSKTWSQAKKYCENEGGYLATITSQGEQDFIESMLNSASRNSYWIGGYKTSSGTWRWVTSEKFSYTNWAYQQPDNCSKSGGESALQVYCKKNPMASSALGQWNDLNPDGTCGTESFFGVSNIGFICEWNSNPSTTKKDQTLTATLETGSIAVGKTTKISVSGKGTIKPDFPGISYNYSQL